MMCVTNKAEIKTSSRDSQLCIQNKLEARECDSAEDGSVGC